MTIKTGSKTEAVFSRVNFVKEQNGENFALGMSGAPGAIQDIYLTLFNAGATNGDLLDIGHAEFAYAWLKRETFAYALAKWELNSLTEAGLIGKADKFTASRRFYFLNAKWLRFFDRISRENFVPYDNNPDFESFGVGVAEGMFSPVANETTVPVDENADTELTETIEAAAA